MKKIWILFLLFASLTFTGCNFIGKTLYGIKNPDFETTRSVLNRQQKLFGSGSLGLVVKAQSWQLLTQRGIPDVYVFDARGRFIPYKDSTRPHCNAPAEKLMAELDPAINYNTGNDFTLETFMQQLNLPGCAGDITPLADTVDYYIFMTWAVWTGKKIYKEKTLPWMNELRNNRKIRYRLFMVNLDLQDCWADDEKKFFQQDTEIN